MLGPKATCRLQPLSPSMQVTLRLCDSNNNIPSWASKRIIPSSRQSITSSDHCSGMSLCTAHADISSGNVQEATETRMAMQWPSYMLLGQATWTLLRWACENAAKAIEDQNALARTQMELAQQSLETQRRQHEQVMSVLTRLEQHLTGYPPAMQGQQQVCSLAKLLSPPPPPHPLLSHVGALSSTSPAEICHAAPAAGTVRQLITSVLHYGGSGNMPMPPLARASVLQQLHGWVTSALKSLKPYMIIHFTSTARPSSRQASWPRSIGIRHVLLLYALQQQHEQVMCNLPFLSACTALQLTGMLNHPHGSRSAGGVLSSSV